MHERRLIAPVPAESEICPRRPCSWLSHFLARFDFLSRSSYALNLSFARESSQGNLKMSASVEDWRPAFRSQISRRDTCMYINAFTTTSLFIYLYIYSTRLTLAPLFARLFLRACTRGCTEGGLRRNRTKIQLKREENKKKRKFIVWVEMRIFLCVQAIVFLCPTGFLLFAVGAWPRRLFLCRVAAFAWAPMRAG